jgi:hypothetical protein
MKSLVVGSQNLIGGQDTEVRSDAPKPIESNQERN